MDHQGAMNHEEQMILADGIVLMAQVVQPPHIVHASTGLSNSSQETHSFGANALTRENREEQAGLLRNYMYQDYVERLPINRMISSQYLCGLRAMTINRTTDLRPGHWDESSLGSHPVSFSTPSCSEAITQQDGKNSPRTQAALALVSVANAEPIAEHHTTLVGSSIFQTPVPRYGESNLTFGGTYTNSGPHHNFGSPVTANTPSSATISRRSLTPSSHETRVTNGREVNLPESIHVSSSDTEHSSPAAARSPQSTDRTDIRRRIMETLSPRVPACSLQKPFDLFQALVDNSIILLILPEFLDYRTMLNLYSISKHFKTLVDQNLLSVVKRNSRNFSFGAFGAYPFLSYKHLCIEDPAGRKSKSNPTKTRVVPTLRYMGMIHFREEVVSQIARYLAEDGHYLPRWSLVGMRKLWALMDIPVTMGRVAVLKSSRWIYEDFYFTTLFMMKLDMRFSRPPVSEGFGTLRKLCLLARSMSFLRDVLARTTLTTEVEVLQAYAEWAYKPHPQHTMLPVAGIPAVDIGRGRIEYWGLTDSRKELIAVYDLVLSEGLERGFDIMHRLYEMVVWGYDSMPYQPIPVHPEERDADDAILAGAGLNKDDHSAAGVSQAADSATTMQSGQTAFAPGSSATLTSTPTGQIESMDTDLMSAAEEELRKMEELATAVPGEDGELDISMGPDPTPSEIGDSDEEAAADDSMHVTMA